jgi:hypothetical protein
VGRIDDPQEREADRVAERAVRTSASGSPPHAPRRFSGERQTVAPPIVHEVLAACGSPLDGATRAFFEPRLGIDLSSVRVHRDPRAAASADAVGARAYTVGSDIVFADGRYAPGTGEGQRLLGHELAHVLQQRGPTSALLARSPAASTEPPAELVSRMIAEEDYAAICAISDEEIAATTPLQRAGMIRVLTDLWWTSAQEEQAIIRLLGHDGQHAAVAEWLDALGYRGRVLDTFQGAQLYGDLVALLGPAPAQARDGGPISAALSSGSADDVMAIDDFSSATAMQRVGLLRILLDLGSSNREEESKMLEILLSARPRLGGLMADLTSAGLKEELFDHVDEPENKLKFIGMLEDLHDPTLKEDLAVFKQGVLGSWWDMITGAIASAWESVSIPALIMGVLHPILNPIDALVGLFQQVEDLTKDILDLDKWLTLLRDAMGLIAGWVGALALICTGAAAVFGASVVLVPGGVSVGVIAASLWADDAALGLAFLALAAAKMYVDLAQGVTATTVRAREKETRELGEGVSIFALIPIFHGMTVAMKGMLQRFRGTAIDPAQAELKALEKTADDAQKTAERVTQDAEEMQAKAGVESSPSGVAPPPASPPVATPAITGRALAGVESSPSGVAPPPASPPVATPAITERAAAPLPPEVSTPSGGERRSRCFVGGTLVLTPEGPLPIESLDIGDRVLALDPRTGTASTATVTRAHASKVSEVLAIGMGAVAILVTSEHPFWVADDGWRTAGELTVGTPLLSESGVSVAVDTITRLDGPTTVYNVTVSGVNTYFVSSVGVLVHNKTKRHVPAPSVAELEPAKLSAAASALDDMAVADRVIERARAAGDDAAAAEAEGLRDELGLAREWLLDAETPDEFRNLEASRQGMRSEVDEIAARRLGSEPAVLRFPQERSVPPEPLAADVVSSRVGGRSRRAPMGPTQKSVGGWWVDEAGNLGVRGESMFVPSNPAALAELALKGLRGLWYKNRVPDFAPVAEAKVLLPKVVKHAEDTRFANRVMAERMAESDPGGGWLLRGTTEGNAAKFARFIAQPGNEFTWHHVPGTRWLLLVPYWLHVAAAHTGASAEGRAAGTSEPRSTKKKP